MKRFALTAFGSAALGLAGGLTSAGTALADSYGRDGYSGYYHDGFMGFHGGAMMGWMGPIMMIAVLVLIGVIIWSLVSAASGRGRSDDGSDSALSVLRERYARGEIDHDEFEERKRRL